MKIRSTLLALIAAAAALCLAAAPAALADQPKPVKVMTWNLYYGFDDGPVAAAAMSGDMALVAQAATEAWRQVHATNFHRRVRDIALWIRLEAPDLVDVQEAVRYVQTGPTGSIVETLDHLDILVAAMRELGLPYEVVSSVDTLTVDLPVLDADANVTTVSIQDRSAILARTSHAAITVSNSQHGIYQYILAPPDFPFTMAQGWASVDVTASGRKFRFVTTHLEDASADPVSLTPLQEAQAMELVNIHAGSGLPVVFAGDFNTDGFRKWPTYNLLTKDLGLTDAWVAVNRNKPGLTWGEAPDLLNLCPRLTQRLDLVLFSGPFRAMEAKVLGASLADRVPAGMWPSDHAGLVVTFVP
jgi:endonuclease/exonuclease/phosphatase family metal-dependent hydrolase